VSSASSNDPLELTLRTTGSVASRSSQLVTRGLIELTAIFDQDQKAMLADALRGDPIAQWKLGRWYEQKATDIYVAQGYDRATSESDFIEAVKWYRLAAEQGYLNARCSLWSYYKYKDEVEAAKWCKKAAEQGHTYAADRLGWYYEWGKGLPQNDAEAARWYRMAAEKGHCSSAVSLGSMYNRGKGVPLDPDEAASWFRIAGQRAIEENDASTMFQLGDTYASGVLCDYAVSMKWFRMAAERGDTMSMICLGEIFHEGLGVEQNVATAVEWYKMAAAAAEPSDAMFGKIKLAFTYEHGLGVPKDYKLAYAWLKQLSHLPTARDNLKSLTERMTPDEIAEAERMAASMEPIERRVNTDK
jgi:uncharacterized protein